MTLLDHARAQEREAHHEHAQRGEATEEAGHARHRAEHDARRRLGEAGGHTEAGVHGVEA